MLSTDQSQSCKFYVPSSAVNADATKIVQMILPVVPKGVILSKIPEMAYSIAP